MSAAIVFVFMLWVVGRERRLSNGQTSSLCCLVFWRRPSAVSSNCSTTRRRSRTQRAISAIAVAGLTADIRSCTALVNTVVAPLVYDPSPSRTTAPELIATESGAKAKPAPPELDGTGKVHGDIPGHVPDDWTDDQLEELEDDLPKSIGTREREQQRLGEDGPHRRRINEERRLLEQIRRKLGGK
jgi:hypothetical protein